MDQHLIDEAVEAAIERAMLKNMEWGRDDCSLWVCGIPLGLTGIDLALMLRGYSNRFGSARALKLYAGGGLVEAAIKIAAKARLKPAFRPFRGNLIGVVMSPERPSLALFWRGHWIARSETGVVHLPASSGVIAWRWI